MWRRTGDIGPQFVGLSLLEEQGGYVDRLSGDVTTGRGHPGFSRFLQRSGFRGRFSSVSKARDRGGSKDRGGSVCVGVVVVVVVVVIVNKIESF